MPSLRLDRFLTECGVCSRREAAAAVRRGRVLVNGARPANAAVKVDTETDRVTVDGDTVAYSAFHYLMMNKPAGVLSATEDGRDILQPPH